MLVCKWNSASLVMTFMRLLTIQSTVNFNVCTILIVFFWVLNQMVWFCLLSTQEVFIIKVLKNIQLSASHGFWLIAQSGCAFQNVFKILFMMTKYLIFSISLHFVCYTTWKYKYIKVYVYTFNFVQL